MDWVDDSDSRVDIKKTATDDLRGVARLLFDRKALISSSRDNPDKATQLESAMRFCRVGVVSTLAYLMLFLMFRVPVGNLWANALALVICTIANVGAHGYLTARTEQGSNGLLVGGTAGFVTSLALTTAALEISQSAVGAAWVPSVVAALLATFVAGVIRFAVFRSLVFQATHQPSIQLSPIDRGDD